MYANTLKINGKAEIMKIDFFHNSTTLLSLLMRKNDFIHLINMINQN